MTTMLTPQQAYLAQATILEQSLTTLSPGHPCHDAMLSAIKLLRQAAGHEVSAKPDNTGVAIIDRGYHWLEITPNSPRGSKVQLVNREYGVATYGKLLSKEPHFTHWAPLPTFSPEV